MSIDPRVSLFTIMILFITILLSTHLILQTGIIVLFILAYFRLTSFRQVIKLCIFFIIPTLFILILNILFVSKEVDYLVLMMLRFWGMTWLFNWFLKQVSPDELAKALWALHVPYNFAWQISLSYRFLPLFQKESQHIYNMQISRGIPLDGNLFEKIKYLPSISIPLIVMTQDKANYFAEALFSRNWNAKTPKTIIEPLKMQIRDYIILLIVICVIFLLFLEVFAK